MSNDNFVDQLNDLIEEYCESEEFEDVFETHNLFVNGKDIFISIQIFNSEEE